MAFCGCTGLRHDSSRGLAPKSLGWAEMEQFVERKTQLTNFSIHGFQRDSHGEKLFINFSFKQSNEKKYRTAIVTSNGFTVVDGAPIVFYNDSGEPAVRLIGVGTQYDSEGRLFYRRKNSYYQFASGARIPDDDITGIVNVTGGDGILLKFKGKPAWTVSALADPMKPRLELPQDLEWPECASSRNDRLVIFGRSKLPDGEHVDCLIYDKTADGYKLQERIPLPWASKAYDFDIESGRALLVGQAQMFAWYYSFNIQSKHHFPKGFAPSDNVLFLSPDLSRALNEK